RPGGPRRPGRPPNSASCRASAEGLHHRREGAAAVTHPVLVLRAGLPEGLPQFVAEEERIVAKAASAARLLQDAAATGAMEDLRKGVRGAQQDDGAAIPRPPPGLRRPEEAAQQFGVVGLVHLARRAAGARPALGPDAE